MSFAADDTSVGELRALGEEFQTLRPRLFGIAYRMLGSVAEAEDVVQDAWVRWQTTDRASVRTPLAFLTTMTTRLAINVAESSRVRRETYIGPWLPEPVMTDSDPTLGAENAESLAVGMLLLMERLTPTERAVYVLREAFDFPFSEIAEVIDTTEANARQLGRRARLHLQTAGAREVPAERHDRLLRSFLEAAQTGNLERLRSLLTDDIVYYGDGGGAVSAALRPVEGRDRVGRFLLGVVDKAQGAFQVDVMSVNGADAVVLRKDGQRYLVGMIGVSDAGIDRIYFVMNPEKLSALRFAA
ncbi:RNA polymerase sigma-70 factor [Pseudoclavibacter sp. RFBA6]|uniref:RNA polymerase sigma-70 factor n=1 Tax=Pseudoclavibacter sp. RFBA6 TaxID=2080573 RepID=UPI000CE7E8B2|nr:RNA polymerase sigma-70 factor [Pseudoclavibacter sp. RFBA6]PPG40494.1 RNA polymerase subunit sigma-24 [Pseudoclavibacter sp. RFBA6]